MSEKKKVSYTLKEKRYIKFMKFNSDLETILHNLVTTARQKHPNDALDAAMVFHDLVEQHKRKADLDYRMVKMLPKNWIEYAQHFFMQQHHLNKGRWPQKRKDLRELIKYDNGLPLYVEGSNWDEMKIISGGGKVSLKELYAALAKLSFASRRGLLPLLTNLLIRSKVVP
jgi:hypothetical protein